MRARDLGCTCEIGLGRVTRLPGFAQPGTELLHDLGLLDSWLPLAHDALHHLISPKSEAADQLGRSRERFVLEAACREAESVLLDKVFFLLDTPAYHQFLAIVDDPPPPNEHLRRLMAMKAPGA